MLFWMKTVSDESGEGDLSIYEMIPSYDVYAQRFSIHYL